MRLVTFILTACLLGTPLAHGFQRDTLSKDSLANLAKQYNEWSKQLGYDDLDSSLLLAKKAQSYAIQSGSALQIARSYFNQAFVYHVKGNFDAALARYDSALLFEKTPLDSVLLSRIWNNLGALYNAYDNYPKAMEYYQKSLNYKLVLNPLGAATTYNNLGIIKYNQKKYDEALQYYQEALLLDREGKDKRGQSRCYGNIGLVYIELEKFDSALRYYDLAYRLLDDETGKCIRMYPANGLAEVYQKTGFLEKAEVFAMESLKEGKACSDPNAITGALITLGLIHQERGDWKRAERQFLEAFDICEKNGLINGLNNLSNYLYQLYKSTGQVRLALSYLEKQRIYKDSLFTEDLSSKLTRLEMEYAFSREKDSLSYSFEKERALLDAEIKQRAQFQRISIIIIILAALAIIFIARSYVLKQRSNQLLAEKNEVVSRSLKEKELLMDEIHHRVKNNLQIVSSLLNIQEKLVVDPPAKAVIKDTKSRVISMALVHDNLYAGENVTNIDAGEYMEELLFSIKETFASNLKPIDFKLNVETKSIPSEIAVPLGLIVNEGVTNSVKYAFPSEKISDPEILIELSDSADAINLRVQDNGVGLGSENTESYGMRLIRTLVENMEGKLQLQNGHGTTLEIEVPLTHER